MEPRQLFELVRALWPDLIILKTDADRKDGEAIWSVVHVYDAVEVVVQDDDWLTVGAWSFHQAITELARLKIRDGAATVDPAEVSFEAFDANMRENLADSSWTEERSLYGSRTGLT